MGFLWDLIQHNQLSTQAERTGSVEQRVDRLERELADTRRLVHELMMRLERALGEDINRDGRVGGPGL